MFQTGDTIKGTLDGIARHDLVLPAIQREFVWDHRQICGLFDSIMQGYPFGAFLFWQIEPEISGQFRFYDFLRHYHERDSSHCPDLPQMVNRKVTAVLDGQQRLTALNVGLRGSMTWKLPYKFRSNPSAYPKRHLYLDFTRFGSRRRRTRKAENTDSSSCPNNRGLALLLRMQHPESAGSPLGTLCQWRAVLQCSSG